MPESPAVRQAPQRRSLVTRLRSVGAHLLLWFSYSVALLAARVLPRARKPRGQCRRVLVTGTFHNAGWYLSHMQPLVSAGLGEIVLVCDYMPPPLDGVRPVCPPLWAKRLLGRAGSKLLWLVIEGWRNPPDLLMGYHIFPGAASALIAGRILRRPVCYQMTAGPIEIIGGGFENENVLMQMLGRFSDRLEQKALRVVACFDLVVVRGRRAETFIQERIPGTRTAIIPGSVAPHRAGPAERIYDLTFVGRLTEFKQPTQFVEIVAELAQYRPEVRAAVAGDGPEMGPMRLLAARLGVQGNIQFLGQLESTAETLAASRIFVLTSRSEGLSIALAEAMLAGAVPVVADVGELAELVKQGETGFLVPPNDVMAFADYIDRLLADEELRQRLAERGARLAAEHMLLDAVSRKWADVVGELMRTGTPRPKRAGRGATVAKSDAAAAIEIQGSEPAHETVHTNGDLHAPTNGKLHAPTEEDLESTLRAPVQLTPEPAEFASEAKDGTASETAPQFFDKQAERWARLYTKRAGFRDRLALFSDGVQRNVPCGGFVLDAGCGSGQIALEIAGQGYQVLGVDGAAEMIRTAERQPQTRGLSNVAFVHCALEELEPPEESFDAVVCSSVIEYLEDDDALLSKFARALKPDGVLLISVPHSGSLCGWLEDALARRSQAVGQQHLRHSRRRYQIGAFFAQLEELGFEIVSARFFDFPRGGWLGVWLSRVPYLGRMMLVEARRRSAGVTAPEPAARGDERDEEHLLQVAG